MKLESRVPTTLNTVTVVLASTVTVVGATRHRIVVPDVQDAVSQWTSLSVTVVVVSIRAKERPSTVELRPPDGGALPLPTRTELTAGAAVNVEPDNGALGANCMAAGGA